VALCIGPGIVANPVGWRRRRGSDSRDVYGAENLSITEAQADSLGTTVGALRPAVGVG
jgi:hypothetical protein